MNNSEKNEIYRLFRKYILQCSLYIIATFLGILISVLYPFEKIPNNFFKIALVPSAIMSVCSLIFILFSFFLYKNILKVGKKNFLIKKLGSIIRKEEKAFHYTDYTVYTSEKGTWIEFEDAPSVEEVKQILNLEFPNVPHMAFYIRLINNKIVVVDYNVSIKDSKESESST